MEKDSTSIAPSSRAVLLVLLALNLYGEGLKAPENNLSSAIIIGGYQESANYEWYFNDIPYLRRLLGGNPAIHYAGGPGSLYAGLEDDKKKFRRDDTGRMVLEKAQFDFEVNSASLQNVRETLERLKTSRALSVSVYFGDHGGTLGPTLWYGADYTAKERRDYVSQIPEKKRVRGIFFHCYSGEMLVDSKRPKPGSMAGLSDYLKKYYSPRFCGLSLSRHDELGRSPGAYLAPEAGPLAGLLKTEGRPTLNHVIEKFNSLDSAYNTMMLTSHYFEEDVFELYCRSRSIGDHRRGPDHAHQTPMKAPVDESALCETREAAKRLDREIGDCLKRSDVVDAVRRLFIRKFLDSKYPEVLAGYRAALSEIEKNEAELAAGEGDAKAIEKRVSDIKVKNPAWFEYMRLFDGINSRRIQWEEFKDYYRENWGTLMKDEAFQKEHPLFFKIRDEPANKGLGLFDLDNREYSACLTVRKRRMHFFQGRKKRIRDVVGGLMKRPEHWEASKLYEAIRRCEDEPLG